MNQLTKFLVDGILNEGKGKVIAAYGGGFKPPTAGHFEVVKKALEQNPEIEELIIFVGGSERDGLTQAEAILIWEVYQSYLPMKVNIQPSKAPIGDVIRLGKNNIQNTVYFIIGGREGRDDDAEDIASRTKGIEEKYPNMKVKVVTTPDSGMSGTNARQAAKVSYEEFEKYLPTELSGEEKEMVYNIVSPAIKEIKLPKISDIKEKFKIFVSKLKQEGKETKAAFALLIKASKGEIKLTDLDKQQIKEQLKDIIKGVFGAAIFSLPAGGLVLLLLKLIKLHGLITPSSFLEENDPEDGKAAPYGSGYNKLNEKLKPYKFKVLFTENEDNTTRYTFTTNQNTEYLIDLIKHPETEVKVEYGAIKEGKKSWIKPTNEGEPFKIISTVTEIIKEYYSNNPGIEVVKWKATKGKNSTKVNSQRDKLNIRFFKREIPNVKIVHEGQITKMILPKLNENASYSKDIDIKGRIMQLTQHMLNKGYNIEPLPTVEFVNGDSENAREFLGKTAYYNPETQTIVLYTEGRHPKDIVRSFAHEIIHHIQNLEGRLGNITTTNTQEDDYLNGIEAEANLKGTMTFRNWTDSLNEAIVGDKIECDGCNWSWKIVDGGDDLFMCHKCGHDNTPLEEKKNKDPFGLNQYARELAQGLEESLNEGRYDSISRQLASIALNSWKSDFKDGASYGYFTGEITPEEYPTDLTFTFKALGRFVDGNYTHNGYSRSDGEVGVKYEIPKDAIPQIWEEVYMDLISTIRHEIEHQTQSGKNVKPGKGMASDQELRKLISKGGSDLVAYVTLPKEIESNVQGLYLKAKKWRRPYDEIADEYIKDFLKITNPADVSYVKNKWQEVAKKRNLPSLLNEGRYDTLTNKLSSIAFEAFKDIHDRGDKEGSFEFRVDHPDDEHDIPSEEFYFDFVGKVEITDDEYEVDGGANAGFDNKGEEITPMLSVKFRIPKNPDWQKVSFDIKDVVRHELEHLTQDGENVKGGTDSDDPKLVRPSKQMEDDQLLRDLIDADLLPKADYFRLPKEIDAMLQGLYFKAKKAKRPFKDVINDYLNIFIDQETITQAEKENILKVWRSRAKSLSLPTFELKEKVMNYTIYLDMDGVLVDFDKQFENISGMPPREYEKIHGADGFWGLIDDPKRGGGVGYWRGMEWMPGGEELYNFASKHPHFLLSSPSRSELSRIGKRMWRKDKTPNTKLILARSYNKKNYADENSILIDDRKDTIDSWIKAGGIGIHYTSSQDAIRQLKDLGL